MELQKRAWDTPELIVLARARAEEAVLDGCKHLARAGTPGTNISFCYTGVDLCNGSCDGIVLS